MKTKPHTITTIPALVTAQIAADQETEKSCYEILAEKDLSPAKRKMLTEVLEVVSQRRLKAQDALAVRLARNDGRLPSRNDGRQPSRGGAAGWSHNQKASE